MRDALCLALACAALAVGCGGGHPGPDAGVDATPQSAACRQDAPNAYRVTLDGTDLGAQEGRSVHVLTEMTLAGAPVTCRIATRTRIVGGHFGAELTNLTDGAAYPLVGVFVDVDGDGTCEPSTDLIWSAIFSLSPSADVTARISAADLSHVDDGGLCGRFSAPGP